jgi:hypothetical protein
MAKLSRDEKLEETEWLMQFGESPEYIARALGVTPNTIYTIAQKRQNLRVRAYFQDFAKSSGKKGYRVQA